MERSKDLSFDDFWQVGSKESQKKKKITRQRKENQNKRNNQQAFLHLCMYACVYVHIHA